MLKAYKYKLKPNDEQKVLLNKHLGSIRFVYNFFLNERKKEYEDNKNTINYYDNAKALTELKKREEYSWLNEINSQSLQDGLKNLETAYKNFFKFKKGFPKFKSKRNRSSFSVPQSVRLENGKLKIPKFKEPIDLILSRKFTGKIKQCTISKTPTNEYFVSILVETEHKKLPKTGKIVGIDLGIKDFVITSDGYKYKNNRYTRTYQTLLKNAQKHLSRKKKGSNRYEKQRLKVAKLHKKITNSRLDNLHKISTDLIRKYDKIILEDLNVKGMIKNHKLAKDISDVSWSKFMELLTYKAEWNDKEIVKIDRFFPSSKTCNCCGYINQNLKLDMREWTCPSCNTKLDRDLNASINILKEGYKIISDGTSDYRSGGEIRPTPVGTTDETSKVSDTYYLESQPSLVVG
jgi:putative transposase